ncbi:MAG: hypothetical protein OJF51_003224 [Nitrospira sp.]|nr:MAG: hypothetical protein OJF51_003224 [Nitrospira sp.]
MVGSLPLHEPNSTTEWWFGNRFFSAQLVGLLWLPTKNQQH